MNDVNLLIIMIYTECVFAITLYCRLRRNNLDVGLTDNSFSAKCFQVKMELLFIKDQ
jgi:hypothetical protein